MSEERNSNSWLPDAMVVRNFLLYVSGAALLRGVGFFLIPIYTRYIIPSEYGKLEMINTFTSTIEIVFTLGLFQVFFMEFFKYEGRDRKELIDRILSAYLLLTTILYLIGGLSVLFFHDLFHPDISVTLILLAISGSYLNFFQNCFIAFLRMNERAGLLTVVQVAFGILAICMNILMVVVWNSGIKGIVVANLITVSLTGLLALYSYRKNLGALRLYITKKDLKHILSLGIMFVPGAIAFWLMNSLSRWMLLNFSGLHEVGIYSVAVKFSSIFDPLVVQPFLSAYSPRTLKGFSEGKFEQKLGKLIPMAIGFFLLVGWIMSNLAVLVVDPSYKDAARLILPLIIGVGFGLVANIANLVIIFHRKIHLGFLSILTGLLVSLLFNYLLVPYYGGIGAAWGTLLGNMVWMSMVLVFHLWEMRKRSSL
ncbi:MAG: oligosaccharide flippase family protein [Bacteroidota bacterium]